MNPIEHDPHPKQEEAINDPRPHSIYSGRRSASRMVTIRHNNGKPVNYQRTELVCGHKLYGREMPKRGCKSCWDTFFASNPDILHATKMVFEKTDDNWKRALEQKSGREFVKQAKRFLAEMAQYVEDQKEVIAE